MKNEEEIDKAAEPLEDSSEVTEEIHYQEKWQRAVADLENMRKRFETERSNLIKYSIEGFVEDLLPVVDNFYRATEHIPADQQASPWVTGIQYIQKNLLDTLEARGIQEIACKAGDVFDPRLHESIGSQESEDQEDVVLEVKTRGYRIHEKILRPAQVIVSKKITN